MPADEYIQSIDELEDNQNFIHNSDDGGTVLEASKETCKKCKSNIELEICEADIIIKKTKVVIE